MSSTPPTHEARDGEQQPQQNANKLSRLIRRSINVTAIAGPRKPYSKTVNSIHKRIKFIAKNLQHDETEALRQEIKGINERLDKLTSLLEGRLADPPSPPSPPSPSPPAAPVVDERNSNGENEAKTTDDARDRAHPVTEPVQPAYPTEHPKAESAYPPVGPEPQIGPHRPLYLGTAETHQERFVRAKWPPVILPSEAAKFPTRAGGDWVEIPSRLRLVWADHKTLEKLGEIQDRLQAAMFPYELWVIRIICELAGDFQQVAIFARNHRPSWVTLVEAVIQVVEDYCGSVIYRGITMN
ncbi:hypothetical protein GGS23DRAFT_172787 [Durotheca rogersii]|uniref:uncharacterized protein n=1 Tax=Durotheca rogersii TaxID=419775 RepID=UPI00221F641D|nr:uncharacterized protein GGS23DRAFT_172787 [Durotheca rogersii]KAI5867351.1 hypothetical protein GGS23DRAFT_172787 [Durotheca rogersii]